MEGTTTTYTLRLYDAVAKTGVSEHVVEAARAYEFAFAVEESSNPVALLLYPRRPGEAEDESVKVRITVFEADKNAGSATA